MHREIRDSVVAACEQQSLDSLASVADDGEGDTIFAIDRVSEQTLLDVLSREVACHTPIVLIAEGLEPDGVRVLPEGARESDAAWRIVVDPIDGTRGLMFQKRSAWILTGVAPNRGDSTSLADIQIAVQTEIPLVKQHLSDTLWAVEGQGTRGERTNRVTGEVTSLKPSPSGSETLENGFSTVARFFPGVQELLGGVYDEWMRDLLGPPVRGKAQCFEDQYICTGGQLYELIVGHDRLVADLRPLLESVLNEKGSAMGLCCHPYDLCTELIAREAGCGVSDARGAPLESPLDIHTDVAWVGTANRRIQADALPALRSVLERRGLLPE